MRRQEQKLPWVWPESPVILVSGSKYWAEREGGDLAPELEGTAGVWGDAWQPSLWEWSCEDCTRGCPCVSVCARPRVSEAAGNLLEHLLSVCLSLIYLGLSILTLCGNESCFTGETILRTELSSARVLASGPSPIPPALVQRNSEGGGPCMETQAVQRPILGTCVKAARNRCSALTGAWAESSWASA